MDAARSISQVTILIPAYGAADKLRVCLRSLANHVPRCCPIFVLDDGTPDDSIEVCCQQEAMDNLTYVRSKQNRGFVATCNWGWNDAAPAETDILLLNSDTEVTAGFLEEMLRVLYSFERHGVVTPRSNNATIYSVPLRAPDVCPEESFLIWQEMRAELPVFNVMPTAVGFCMLIKAVVLERFGLFDEIYSPGYNEENDFVCRINLHGYSAVVANQAFVFHYESSTFGSRRATLEADHRQILISRYPEYAQKISTYLEFELDPVEKFGILRRKHRPRVLYDLFHLPAKHSGSSEFALSLLRDLFTQTQDIWDLFVGVSEEARFFSGDLNGYRLFDDRPGSEMVFDVAFKPCQIFTWAEFKRMNRLSPRLSFVLQDIIAVRSDYLGYMDRKTIFAKTIELADQIYTISRYTHADAQAYFGRGFPSKTIHHGTNAGLTSSESMKGEYVLLVGNSFAHKGVKEAVKYLTDVGPVYVLGGDKPLEVVPEHIQWVTSGKLTRGFVRELYAKASVVVYPSHYEGYGLPIAEGLALGKTVVALDSDLNREIAYSIKNDNLILVKSLRDLHAVVSDRLHISGGASAALPLNVRRWSDVARDYAEGLQELLGRPLNAAKMRSRSECIRLLHSAGHL